MSPLLKLSSDIRPIRAAQDVGSRVAVRQLGGTAELAADYMTAEFGEGPHHSWIAAAIFLTGFQLVLITLLGEAAGGFADGIKAVNPHASGTFTWHGVAHLQTDVTYVFINGHWTSTGGAMAPLAWALLLAGTILAGRLWRAVPTLRRRRATRRLSRSS